MIAAYRRGEFPMADPETGEIEWLSPEPRAILPLDDLRVSRSLARAARSGRWEIRSDTAFADVLEACAQPRLGSEMVWIDERLAGVFTRLHERGIAHSVEAWREGALVGGLYGTHLGAAFFGESMFHRAELGGSDASKICLIRLVQWLGAGGFELLDVQFLTPHLASLGCIEIPRPTYLERLRRALRLSARWPDRDAIPREPEQTLPRLAVLVNPSEAEPPSDEQAIQRLVAAAVKVGFDPEVVGPGDFERIAEFDALFLRETTSVTHHTYRFACRAAAAGLVVIDDPQSIVRCTDKVFLAEALRRARVPTPETWIVDRGTADALARRLPYPCVLKRPDGCGSLGVLLIDGVASFRAAADRLFEDSDRLVAQEFLLTEFDWRIGVLEGSPLFAARYPMVPGHWQTVLRDASGVALRHGGTEAVPLARVPHRVVELALAAAAVVGDGLYGVDLKQRGEDCRVIEVNDNPNLDADCEDGVLGEELYQRILQTMLDRHERRERIRDHR